MIHLQSIRYQKPSSPLQDQFPFRLPIIDGLEEIRFQTSVTFLVGENGAGKSTLLESMAAAVGSIVVGAESIQTDPTLAHARLLAKQLKLTWRKKTKRGFFLRAEDFFNFSKQLASMRAEMQTRLRELDAEYMKNWNM